MDDTLDIARPLASLIVPCKGRLGHLRRTLPNMLAQACDFAFEVIVVDFSCPQGTFDWCRSLDVRGLTVLKVHDDAEIFHLSRARNCGASAARGRVLAFVDADVRPEPAWLENATRAIRQGRAGFATVAPGFAKGSGCWGTWAIATEFFHAIRGYDEVVRGWGGDDVDLYARAAARAVRVRFGPGLLTPIEHGDAERVRYQPEKDAMASNAHNERYLAVRRGVVNPQGYGQGDFTIFRGQGRALPPIIWTKRRKIVRMPRTGRLLSSNS